MLFNREPSVIEGARFGRLTVQHISGKTPYYTKIWQCICDCGSVRNVQQGALTTGRTQSCGCLQRERVTTHGMTNTPEFKVWRGMLNRIFHPKPRDLQNYADRGISVSDEWKDSFEVFYRDMGPRPSPKHSIERIDNDKGYCKENCKWATAPEQHANKRTNVVIELEGTRLISSEWSRLLGGRAALVRQRLQHGWPVERALTTPSRRALKEKLNVTTA